MPSGRNALTTHKDDEPTGLTVTGRHAKKRRRSKAQRELNAIRTLGLVAILLGFAALTLIGVKLFEGEAAGKNATVLLEAYKAKATATPVVTVSPEPTEAADTPEPSDDSNEDLEQTDADADASAAADADEHLADDGSNEGVDESGEYVQPDAPDVSELSATIEKIINATGEDGVIGILEIPELNQELPIIGKWSYNLLKISICRYKGPDPNEAGNLVLIGHNYKSGAHFGQLKSLSVGSEIYLTDSATGTRVRYVVYQIKSIAPDSFSALDSYKGTCGLTLMTCKDNGTNRLLVRCEQEDAADTQAG
ncbi:MAG TPA: sortase [Eubacteriales bacterium]|nr:sortase [Eubacteriales bacterium]